MTDNEVTNPAQPVAVDRNSAHLVGTVHELSVPTKLDQITNPHLAEDSRLESNLGDRWPPICLSYDVGDAFRPHLRGVLAAAAICRPEYLPKDSTLGRKPMDRLEFEAELRRDGYRVVNTSVKPNLVAPNHCHDFDAKALVLGGEITITRDNNPVTFQAGQCFEVPSGCMHAEHVGLEGVALLSGRRRNGGPLTREAFESDLRREGFEVIHGGQKADFTEDMHAHDFDVLTRTAPISPRSSGPLLAIVEASQLHPS